MDDIRRIRFFIPPFIFFLSLFWGGYLSEPTPPWITEYKTENLLGLVAALGVSAIPLGFLISTISIFILRLLSHLLRRRTYEVSVDDDTRQRIRNRLGQVPELDRNWEFYEIASFDHGLLPNGVNRWIARRWTTFNVSAHSCVAVLIAYVLAPLLSISWSWGWSLSTAVVIVMLYINARISYRETMRMIEFQSHLDFKGG